MPLFSAYYKIIVSKRANLKRKKTINFEVIFLFVH